MPPMTLRRLLALDADDDADASATVALDWANHILRFATEIFAELPPAPPRSQLPSQQQQQQSLRAGRRGRAGGDGGGDASSRAGRSSASRLAARVRAWAW